MTLGGRGKLTGSGDNGNVAGSGFVDGAVGFAENGIGSPGLLRGLVGENIGEETDSFNIASRPALVGNGDELDAGIARARSRYELADGDDQYRRVIGRDATMAFGLAARDLEVNRRLWKSGAADTFPDQCVQLFYGEGVFQPDGVEAEKEPVQMFGNCERLAAVGAQKLIHRIGELVAAILDMDHGVFEREKLPVDVSDFWHGLKRL